jgi:hypothetical protein
MKFYSTWGYPFPNESAFKAETPGVSDRAHLLVKKGVQYVLPYWHFEGPVCCDSPVS